MEGASAVSLFMLVLLGVAAAAAGISLLWRNRHDPVEREKRRRLVVHQAGRMGDAFITDFRQDVIYYRYEVRGVSYEASQSVEALHACLPADSALVIGHAVMKYHPRNPANSIIVCEHWSGLRSVGENRTPSLNEKEIA